MKDLMVDLETMGTGHDAAIIQLGAVYFDRETGEIGDSFLKSIDLNSCLKAGLTFTADTIKFWMKQSEEARANVLGDAKELEDVLEQFAIFTKPDSIIWCHATFDAPVLANAYNKCMAIDTPYRYSQVRDLRTIIDMANINPYSGEFKKEGTAHTAYDDCIFQIKYAVAAMNKLAGKNG